MIIVIPYSLFNLQSISITISVFLVSRSPVGSSKNNIYGLLDNDLAIVTLYCSPPDNWFGKWSYLLLSPTISNNSYALFFISDLLRLPYNIIGNSTFSSAFKEGTKLNV